jgi:hypothetical protein
MSVAVEVTRLHTLRRGDLMLWADRVPAMHGKVNLFTVWRIDGAEFIRLIGGATMPQLRAFIARTNATPDGEA